MRQLASSLYYIFYQLIKKNVKIVQNNDSKFDEEDPSNRKPRVHEKDTIDKDIKPSDWYKTKKQSEEQPPIRDILESELLNLIFKDVPEFSVQITNAMEQMVNTVYAKFYPVFNEVKSKQLAFVKAQEQKHKEELQGELKKSNVDMYARGRSNSRKGTRKLQPPLDHEQEDAESFKQKTEE